MEVNEIWIKALTALQNEKKNSGVTHLFKNNLMNTVDSPCSFLSIVFIGIT